MCVGPAAGAQLENTLLSGGSGVPQLKICDFGLSKAPTEVSEAHTLARARHHPPAAAVGRERP